MSLQRGRTARVLWHCVLLTLVVVYGVEGQQDDSPTIAQYLQQKSNNAMYIAGNATDNEKNCNSLAISKCLSVPSTLTCTNVPTSDLNCTTTPRNNDTKCGVSEFCTSTFLSYAYSSIRLPGLSVVQLGTNPGLINANEVDLVNRDVCVHQPLDAVFKKIVPTTGTNSTFLDWAYFGTARGVMRAYPYKVREQSPPTAMGSGGDVKCIDYDPRRRNWFNGAASQSKTLVILIDLGSTGGSLGSFALSDLELKLLTPLDMIKSTTSRLLDTLRAFDSVAVYTFQGNSVSLLADAIPVTSYDTPRTAEPGVQKLNAALAQLSPSTDARSGSNIIPALKQAATLFQSPPKGSLPVVCEKALIVLTDGGSLANFDPAAAANITLSAGASLFVFSVGDAGRTQNDALLQNFTCQASGIWGRLNNYQDPLLSLYPYFNYLAFKSVYKGGSSTYLTQPYNDASINSTVVTHSKPVFDPAGNFVGVSGDDFPIGFGSSFKYGQPAAYAALTNITETCSGVQLTFCDLQRIRAQFTCPVPTGQSSCSSPSVTCPANAVPAGSVVLKNPGVISNIIPLTCCGNCAPQNMTPIAPVSGPTTISPVLPPMPINPTNPPPSSEDKGVKTGVIVGVIAGVVVGLILLGLVIWACWFCYRQKTSATEEATADEPDIPKVTLAPITSRGRSL